MGVTERSTVVTASPPGAADVLVRVEGVGRRYRARRQRGRRARGRFARGACRGVRRRARPVGVRQDDAAEHDRRARLADRGPGRRRRARHHAGVAQGAVRVSPPRRELRVPDVQPLPGADGAGERGVRRGRRRPAGADRDRRRRCSSASVSATGCATSRTSCRAASSSASRSRGRSPRGIRRCSRTSRPASWTSGPGIQILELLHAQAHTGRAVVVVTHNREIARVADRVIELSSGRVVRRGAAGGRPGRDRRPALVSHGTPAPSAAVDPVGAARCAAPPSAGAVDRAAARARRRHVRRDEQHVGLARRLGRRQLRRPAHARPARDAGRGQHRAARAHCALRLAAARRAGDVAAAAERLVVSTQVDASTQRAHDHRAGTDRRHAAGRGRRHAATCARRLPAAAGSAVVALEHNFARHYDLPASGRADARRRAARAAIPARRSRPSTSS